MRLDTITRRESGYALPLALLSIAVFSIFISVYLVQLTGELKLNNSLVNKWQSKYAADSGLQNALFEVKYSIQHPSSHLGDITDPDFGLPADKLLPSNNLNITTSGGTVYYSSANGTFDVVNPTTGDTATAGYTWVIEYNFTTPDTVDPRILVNNITVQSVGTYKLVRGSQTSRVRSRIEAVVNVKFVPAEIPDSPTQIALVSYNEVGRFAWEQAYTPPDP